MNTVDGVHYAFRRLASWPANQDAVNLQQPKKHDHLRIFSVVSIKGLFQQQERLQWIPRARAKTATLVLITKALRSSPGKTAIRSQLLRCTRLRKLIVASQATAMTSPLFRIRIVRICKRKTAIGSVATLPWSWSVATRSEFFEARFNPGVAIFNARKFPSFSPQLQHSTKQRLFVLSEFYVGHYRIRVARH